MKASDYANQLAAVWGNRPTFVLSGPQGPAHVAHIDVANKVDDGSMTPVIVLQSCALDYARFKELADWARSQFEEE